MQLDNDDGAVLTASADEEEEEAVVTHETQAPVVVRLASAAAFVLLEMGGQLVVGLVELVQLMANCDQSGMVLASRTLLPLTTSGATFTLAYWLSTADTVPFG